MKKIELLAPAGSFNKLKTAFYFGADAVYLGGKSLSLRSFAENFTEIELANAVEYAHALGKKIYVTVNIYARNADFERLKNYLIFLYNANVDAVIVSDLGVFDVARNTVPALDVHISTQANTLNKYSAAFWAKCGAKRIILARELSIKEISEIREYLPQDIELEAFCHGAMCISYSGRCLLSDYFTGRPSNSGECVQACRWNYSIREKKSDGEFYDICEDDFGTYILNSKDLNMIDELDKMIDAGICSFKIEGRMKSEYYLATVVNAYRRALDDYYLIGEAYKQNDLYNKELLKTNHRAFTKAYMFGKNSETVNYENTQSMGDKAFIAAVLGYDDVKGIATIEMRNRFAVGDTLEVLTPFDYLNYSFKVESLTDTEGKKVEDAKLVQQILLLKTPIKLHAGDILRK